MANAVVTVDATSFDTAGLVRLTWTNANKGANWYSWRVYRRDSPAGAWTLLKEFLSDQANYSYEDYSAKANVAQDWVAVRTHLVTGVPTEEAKTPVYTATPASSNYWLIHPYDTTQIYPLYQVTSDNFSTEVDKAELPIIGRGRKIDHGTYIGIKGSLSCQLRDKDLRVGNIIANGSFELDSNNDGYPDTWSNYGGGNAVGSLQTGGVHGDKQLRVVTLASGLGIVSTAEAPGAPGVNLSMIPYRGRTLTWSIYRNVNVRNSGSVQPTIYFRDAGGTVVGTLTLPDSGAFVDSAFTRISGSAVVPATATYITPYLTGSLIGTVYWDASQLEIGAAPSTFVPGEQFSALNTTARSQLEELKTSHGTASWFWLRNPFGDITRVSISNLQVNRLAGVGLSEFTDISFDYSEVAA